MSLRGIHLLFISCSVLVCGFFGRWALEYYQYAGGKGLLTTSVGSFTVAAALSVYAVIFARKTVKLGLKD